MVMVFLGSYSVPGQTATPDVFGNTSQLDLPGIAKKAVPEALYLSGDHGESWTGFTDGLPADALSQQLIDVEGDLFLTTSQHGLFHLPENECEWRPIGEGLPDRRSVNYTAIDGDGERMVLATLDQGIYVSEDGGKHWRKPVFNIVDRRVMCLEAHGGVLYAGTGAGIWESFDYGASWRFGEGEMFPVYDLLSHDNQLLIARQNGLGVVGEDGITWSAIETRSAVTQLFAEGDGVYALTASREVLRSADGHNWSVRPASAGNGNMSSEHIGEAPWGGFWPSLPVDLPPNYSTRLLKNGRGWVCLVRGGC